ncbi:Uu.00g067190.m01.CDS01 [Anthostomella pinea]|uniref:Uu.00g067190.m01.CDS01 n=1 Tax=Anthostomella pinea TaxID=933095 RepID=A0AAI8VU45_9PEZI|nr:Uu.00g067190.m01.CDS01 [Anthostomella pinea]
MSLTNTLARSPTHVLSSRAALSRVPSITSTTGPATTPLPIPIPPAAPRILAAVPVVSHQELAPIWFNSTFPRFDLLAPGNRPDDERKVKLGKTLRVIQERLPSLLQSPLPQEILSRDISLHLFPSTHPYLPTVSGRVAYIAALWSSPIAWNRVPIIGNVKLQILSERMTSQPLYFSPRRPGAYGEQLVVKWRTASANGSSNKNLSLTEQGEQKLDDSLRGSQTAGEKKSFTGLFIFEFDKDGRIISHTIEHVDEHGEWEKGVGARVVGLTDWLLGGIKGRTEGGALPVFEITDKDGGKGVR